MRLIQKCLNAGVLEKGTRTFVEAGSPQGGSASPLLANIYLHYVFDLWVQAWRKKRAHGDVIVVRYADDIVVGFEFKTEAEEFWKELAERMAKFQLELHPEKTRLFEFGRHAAANRKRLGLGKPETFDFLGFKHICGKTKKARFLVLRQTVRKRVQAKLQQVKIELWRRMHDPVPEVGKWLKSVVGGHFRYFGVPGNGHAMAHFRFTVSNLWHRTLCRRSQHGRVLWERMNRLIRRWLPPAHICHPYPSRMRVTTIGKIMGLVGWTFIVNCPAVFLSNSDDGLVQRSRTIGAYRNNVISPFNLGVIVSVRLCALRITPDAYVSAGSIHRYTNVKTKSW